MKKTMSMLLAAAMAVVLAAGCAGAPETTTKAPETSKGTEPAAGTTTAQGTDGEAASDRDCDIVIVGAGGAGMIAALQAVDAGAQNVIIVEKLALTGGNTVRSTGGMNAAKTPNQDSNEFAENSGVEKTLNAAKESYAENAEVMALVETVEKQYADYQANPEGYFDSVELFELDTLVGGKAVNNVDLVKTWRSIRRSPSSGCAASREST